MNIRAKIKYDFEAAKALAYVSVFKKYNPKKRFLFLTCTRVFLLFVYALLWLCFQYLEVKYGVENSWELFCVFFMLFGLVLIWSGIWAYCFFPKKQYESQGHTKDRNEEYQFLDESFVNSSDGEELMERSLIRYTVLFNVYETDRYLFLFRSKTQAYLVDKRTVEGGTCEELREKLKSYVGENNYIRCNW